ncbi:non-hydrolyzing UDP-N-acetylglucosamine 2-epimerase [Desmospora profundinema]|uniref:UDP-N-acetylglucosamine 2-epimerase (non-hydrolyzing) n=1 Tax=Desmospora profundinema TaxID=1571184 RepID=A0ABU1ING1_9BACL|nr:UDP-N-acetylglucosamine 2-epimerase (non-hydrolyzing) [Desmospora profundinema]MDR6225509.1 UDP-N-acetylglucosamine 2-epimerase (non-hydrolyzing) [Desmospora profundinema]
MERIHIAAIFGTRPEAIKMAPLIRHLRQRSAFDVTVCVTGQHREMLDQVLQLFSIQPDVDLDVMSQGQGLAGITARVLEGLEPFFSRKRPNLVLVHGDTATTFAASLAAYYCRIPVGHVEAGLRTGNKYAPFPEEMNRCLTGILADLHFAPTRRAADHLLKEGKPEDSVFITGNTVIDAMQTTVRENFSHPVLEKIKEKRIIMVTAHRRENWGEPMIRMFRAIRRLLDRHADTAAVFPVHLNPAVQETARYCLGDHKRVHLIPPLEVDSFHNFIARSHLIFTDSGGVQEEAPSLGVPVLVMRETTERPEGVEAGTLRLVGTDENRLYEVGDRLLREKREYEQMARAANPYGDGRASTRIADAILYYFGRIPHPPVPFKL